MGKETRVARTGSSLRLSAKMRARARRHPDWEADVIAVPANVEGGERSYPTATLVCAGPIVVAVDIEESRGAEPDQVAERIERAVSVAAESLGAWPEEVFVRHPEVAAALGDRFESGLGPPGLGDPPLVSPTFYLDHLDEPARDLVSHMAGEAVWPPVAVARTWSAWGLPEAEVASLFAAAAAYHRAAPWRLLDDLPPLTLVWPDADEWTLAVLGAAGISRGLAVYADYEDYDAAVRATSPGNAVEDPGNWVLGLTFVDRSELSWPMQREVAGAGWDVAAPDAYPIVAPMLTPGGGLSVRLARRLARALEAVTALVESHADRLKRGPATGSGSKAAPTRASGLGVPAVPQRIRVVAVSTEPSG